MIQWWADFVMATDRGNMFVGEMKEGSLLDDVLTLY